MSKDYGDNIRPKHIIFAMIAVMVAIYIFGLLTGETTFPNPYFDTGAF